jgi:hypothetical protein
MDSSGNLTHSIHTTNINVVGCNAARLAAAAAQLTNFLPPGTELYTAYPRRNSDVTGIDAAKAKPAAVAIAAAPDAGEQQACVRGLKFWRDCVAAAAAGSSTQQQQQTVADEACLIIDQRLPGGRGHDTPFFQLRSSKHKHTYGSILLADAIDTSSSKASSMYLKIAQSYVAAQLNQLSGVVMPAAVRQAQVFLAAKYFSVVTDSSSVKPEVQKKAAAAEAVLASFNDGSVPGVPACKQARGK